MNLIIAGCIVLVSTATNMFEVFEPWNIYLYACIGVVFRGQCKRIIYMIYHTRYTQNFERTCFWSALSTHLFLLWDDFVTKPTHLIFISASRPARLQSHMESLGLGIFADRGSSGAGQHRSAPQRQQPGRTEQHDRPTALSSCQVLGDWRLPRFFFEKKTHNTRT